MLIYLVTLTAAVLLALGAERASRPFPRRLCLFALFLLLGAVAGFRLGVGTDYTAYVDTYTVSQNTSYAALLTGREPLFALLCRLCADLFGTPTALFALSAFLSVGLILSTLLKCSPSLPLSLFLFVTGMHYFDLFNGTRQMMAAALLFAACPMVKTRRWGRFFLLALLACCVHTAALIPAAALVAAARVRPGSAVMWLGAAAFLFCFLFYGDFAALLTELLERSGSAYAHYGGWLTRNDLGAHPLRFALCAVPALGGLLLLPCLEDGDGDPASLVNLSVLNALFLLLATRCWLFARLSIFFGLYDLLLWPRLIHCFDRPGRKLLYAGVGAVYFLYFWLIVHTDSHLLPYRSVLFGGVFP